MGLIEPPELLNRHRLAGLSAIAIDLTGVLT